jgi:hemerythrin
MERGIQTDKVVQFQESFEADRAEVSVELMQFLSSWLTHHIDSSDKKVGDYLRQRAH